VNSAVIRFYKQLNSYEDLITGFSTNSMEAVQQVIEKNLEVFTKVNNHNKFISLSLSLKCI
jgi:hypothetical protein